MSERDEGHDALPAVARLGVVCAHPDDESFGLGAIVAAFAAAGTRVELVCFTCGEGSTLGAHEDLAARRTAELSCAATALGVADVALHHHPDGGLADVDLDDLVRDVMATAGDADALLTYDHGGITGHPDHQRATDAAVEAGRRLGIAVWGWALTEFVAASLREEFGAPFVGRSDDEIERTLAVDRATQHAAMACHGSQLTGNPVPARRLELQGEHEHLRLLVPARDRRPHGPRSHATTDRQELPR